MEALRRRDLLADVELAPGLRTAVLFRGDAVPRPLARLHPILANGPRLADVLFFSPRLGRPHRAWRGFESCLLLLVRHGHGQRLAGQGRAARQGKESECPAGETPSYETHYPFP